MKLHFDNSFARLPSYFYSKLKPFALQQPELVHANRDVAALLDINETRLDHPDFVKFFSGNKQLAGSDPLAMVYAGHQFGYYVPQLGDGRALLLGEVKNKSFLWDVQLKGAGITPYSRMGDGRAVLRSSIREYLCSEAMHALGIPTTRALCIVRGDDPVYRYEVEPAAVLTRVSESHIRFGHFEYFYYTRQFTALKELADYILARHYPGIDAGEEGYLHFFQQAVLKTAKLIAQWQSVGFCHGVMNTDNMSVLGLTIDYGPFGFLDHYDANHICNGSDEAGRYAYDQQPAIAYWNLVALAQALTPLLTKEKLQGALALFEPALVRNYTKIMSEKLGFADVLEGDMDLGNKLLELLQKYSIDYTIFFRQLSRFGSVEGNRVLSDLLPDEQWFIQYSQRLSKEKTTIEQRRVAMDKINPKYILRNYLAEEAIKKAYESRDYSEIDKLFTVLQRPFDEQAENEKYAQKPPLWAKTISVSCSS